MGWPADVDDTARLVLAESWLRREWLRAQLAALAMARVLGVASAAAALNARPARAAPGMTPDEAWELLGG